MPDGREPPRALERIGLLGGPAQVSRQQLHPRLAQALVDDVEQRPHGPLGEPRVRLRIHARRRRHRRADEPPGRGELHVGADPVRAAVRGAEPRGQLLRDPALHAPRRDRDDLSRERVVGRRGEQRAQRLDEPVGAV